MRFLAFLLIFAAGPALAAPQWSLVADESRLGFTAMQSGKPVDGRFERFSADIVFDPDDLAASRVAVEIDMTSVTTGSADRDQTIKSDVLFAVAEYPSARFEGEGFEKTETGYAVTGALTIRETTKEERLPFTLTIEEGAEGREARARGGLTIKRLDYGVGQGMWEDTSVVPNGVEVSFDILAREEESQ